MKLTDNMRKGFIIIILLALGIYLLSVSVGRMSILDTDAVYISRPSNDFNSQYGKIIYITVTFDPQLTTVTGDNVRCRAYQILMEDKSSDYFFVVYSIAGQYLENRFTIQDSFLLMREGEYQLTAYFKVENYVPPPRPERSLSSTSTTTSFFDSHYKEMSSPYDDSPGTEFHNYITITIGEAPDTTDTTTEVIDTTTEQTTPSFTIAVVIAIPIILIWRKFNEIE